VLQPMLASPAPGLAELPRGPQWAYEIKWDGVRALADTTGGRLRLWSRNGNDVTAAYPELGGLAVLPDAVIDGEIVAMAGGVPSFAALAARMHVRDTARAAALARSQPVTFVVFDVLTWQGRDVTGLTYDERRAVLDVLPRVDQVQPSPVYPDGDTLWQVTRDHGLEGVVAKLRTSTYQPGRRSRDWVKLPHRRNRTALVGGWREESAGTGRLGAVLLGARDEGGALRYLGRAGSGLAGPLATAVRGALAEHARATSPFDNPVPATDARGTHWCEPLVVVDTLYLSRTPGGRLRQPVVRGVRTDTGPDPWEQE